MNRSAITRPLHDTREPSASSPTQVATEIVSFGGLRGEFVARHLSDGFLEWLGGIEQRLQTAEAQVLRRVRNLVAHLPYEGEPGWAGVCVKQFARPPLLHGIYYGRRAGKAEKSMRHSMHLARAGVGVAEPLGYLERCVNGRLLESWFLSAYLKDMSDFDRESAELLGPGGGDRHAYHALLRGVAQGVRAMHDSRFVHHDLGGQNILLRRLGERTWSDPVFIDLNRGRVRTALTLRARAKDVARLEIPAAERQVFFEMYFDGAPVPAAFLFWQQAERLRFSLHKATHAWRHPIRSVAKRRAARATENPLRPKGG